MRKLHLWLGLLSGLIVFVVAFTGAMYSFSEEISDFVYKDRKYIKETSLSTKRLPLDALQKIADNVIPEKYNCQRVLIPNSRTKSISFCYMEMNKGEFWYPNYMEFYKTVYINPYSGNVIKIEDTKWEFFNVVLWIHMTLFFGYNKLGITILVVSMLIFIVMLISGIVLWFPKKNKFRKKDFRFKWKRSTSWKRKNYDLHKILGLYVVLFGLILSVTGLFWAFPGFNKSIKKMLHTGRDSRMIVVPSKNQSKVTLQSILEKVKEMEPNTHFFLVKHPKKNNGIYTVRCYLNDGYNYNRIVYYFTTKEEISISKELYSNKNIADKIQALNYDIHVGSIAGVFGKIIMFIASIIIASLPVTGFIFWMNRKKKLI